jgi:hypothetical protein
VEMLLYSFLRIRSPIPAPRSPLLNGGIFLWHYPHDRSHWELPSKFGLSEARTFLEFNE